MNVLTPEEARVEGYCGYAYHIPNVACPQDSDPLIYCATCAAISQLNATGHEAVIDIRGFPTRDENSSPFDEPSYETVEKGIDFIDRRVHGEDN